MTFWKGKHECVHVWGSPLVSRFSFVPQIGWVIHRAKVLQFVNLGSLYKSSDTQTAKNCVVESVDFVTAFASWTLFASEFDKEREERSEEQSQKIIIIKRVEVL